MGRIIVPRDMEQPIFAPEPVRMGGKVRCQIHKGKSGTLKHDTGWFHNIITDDGVGYFANCPYGGAYGGQVAIFGQCAVGTGSGTPAVSDTTLFDYLVSTNNDWTNSTGTGYVAAASPTPPYWWNQNQFVFATGVAAGNLTEIGIYPMGVTYGSGLFSHALILDSNGNPTSITVLSDEVLTVTYQTNFYIDLTDHSFSFPLNGTTNTGTYRMLDVDAVPNSGFNGAFATYGNYRDSGPQLGFYTGDIGVVTASPSGSNVLYGIAGNSGNWSSAAYIDVVNDMANSGTWYYDFQATWPTGIAATMLSMTLSHSFIQYQFGELETPIVKTSGQQLSASFRASWGRYGG